MRARSWNPALIAWLVAVALLAVALVPTVASWRQAEAVPSLHEICTLEGARLVTVDPAAAPGRAPGHAPTHAVFDHCPCCFLHHVAALPPAPIPELALLSLGFGLPERFFSAPRTPHAWATAQPRGPPIRT